MSAAFFSKVTKWAFPADALEVAFSELRLDGVRSTEGIALWLGHRSAGIASVTHMVYLRGSGLLKTEYHIRVSHDLFNEVTDSAINLGKTLIGQIHSHPRRRGGRDVLLRRLRHTSGSGPPLNCRTGFGDATPDGTR